MPKPALQRSIVFKPSSIQIAADGTHGLCANQSVTRCDSKALIDEKARATRSLSGKTFPSRDFRVNPQRSVNLDAIPVSQCLSQTRLAAPYAKHCVRLLKLGETLQHTAHLYGLTDRAGGRQQQADLMNLPSSP
jgi:hypothetical protein